MAQNMAASLLVVQDKDEDDIGGQLPNKLSSVLSAGKS